MKPAPSSQGFTTENIQQLVNLGVPKEAVVRFGLEPGQSTRGAVLSGFIYVVLMLGLFAPIIFLMMPQGALFLQGRGFIPAEAVMAKTGFPSALLLIFAAIFTPGCGWPSFNRRNPCGGAR